MADVIVLGESKATAVFGNRELVISTPLQFFGDSVIHPASVNLSAREAIKLRDWLDGLDLEDFAADEPGPFDEDEQ